MKAAFKEWAVIVDALGSGAQIIILRKGGISEGPAGFQIEQPEFFFFPTLFHQQRDAVLPAAQARYDHILPLCQDAAVVKIEYFARVSASRQLREMADAERLRGQHVWRDEVIARRFDWGRDKSIQAIALRVYRLAAPRLLPIVPGYGGCKSWIDLELEPDLAGATPVLDDASFNARLDAFQNALETAESPG